MLHEDRAVPSRPSSSRDLAPLYLLQCFVFMLSPLDPLFVSMQSMSKKRAPIAVLQYTNLVGFFQNGRAPPCDCLTCCWAGEQGEHPVRVAFPGNAVPSGSTGVLLGA